MSRSTIEYLQHILDETLFLINQTQGLTFDKFMQDDALRRAFVRSLEIVGEAVKYMPAEWRQKYSQVNWRSIAGMRDRLIHGYFSVDYDIVWDVVTNHIPVLQQEIRRIIEEESKSE